MGDISSEKGPITLGREIKIDFTKIFSNLGIQVVNHRITIVNEWLKFGITFKENSIIFPNSFKNFEKRYIVETI